MAVRIIEGVPGSGKSYYAVHHILDKYCEFDGRITEWKKKKEFQDLVIITNLDGFPYSLDLETLIEKAGSMEVFFSFEYQSEFAAGRPVIYLIDEAQAFFPFTYRDTRVFLFFQKHRHLGMDIYLLTQDAEHLAKGLRSLAEFHIVAARRSLAMFNELRYRFVDPQTRECWMTKVLKKDGKYFSFYKSFTGLETEQIKSVPRRFGLVFAVGILVVLVGGYVGIWRQFGGRGVAKVSAASPAKVAPAPVALSIPGFAQASAPVPAAVVSQPAVVPVKKVELPVSVVGSFSLTDEQGFLVRVQNQSVKLGHGDMVSVCRCHADNIKVGDVYMLEESLAPNILRSFFQGDRAVTQSPVYPPGRLGF